jgi:hypothetical protein
MSAGDKPRTQLIRALARNHVNRCGQNSCDICAAYKNENYLWAAHLLIGATECSRTEKAFLELDPSQDELDAECKALLNEVDYIECPGCQSLCWSAEVGDQCDNCHAYLVEPKTEEPGEVHA